MVKSDVYRNFGFIPAEGQRKFGIENTSEGEFSSNPWINKIATDYFITKGAYSGDADKSWAVTELVDWLQTGGYAHTTFGPAGQDKSVADFFILLRHDGDTTANIIAKTGATLRHDIGDSTYNQDNVPAHTFDGNERWVISSTDGYSGMTEFRTVNCNITGIIYYNVQLINLVFLFGHTNPDLINIKFLEEGNVITSLDFNSCGLTGEIDLSNVRLNSLGAFYFYFNSGITDITFSTGSLNTTNIINCQQLSITSLDLSNVRTNSHIDLRNSSSLSEVTWRTGDPITTNIDTINYLGCALSILEVDNLFSVLNTFFTANTPIINLTVNTSGGTNGVPTGGESNTDITNLESIFTGAGHLFTAIINT